MPFGRVESFDLASPKWTMYVDRVKQFIALNEIKDSLHVATLITVVGQETYDLMCDLCAPAKPESKSFKDLVTIVKNHLEPKRSDIAERHTFRQRRQRPGEELNAYLQHLKHLASTCNFADKLEDNLRDQFVSVCAAAEARRCYWCGPLAEQVHRSRRAPACAPAAPGGAHVTACEPGLAHCAVVATSPPHTESRLCVKFYQDECYPLFCNSSKTWRMTCPCRGDLCNGPNTEREAEAFTILAKLVAKTQNSRIVKRTVLNDEDMVNESSQVMPENENTLQNDTAKTANDDPETDQMQNDVSKQIDGNQVGKTVADDNNYTTQTLSESSQRTSDNSESNMQADEPDNYHVMNNIQSDEPSTEHIKYKMQSEEHANEQNVKNDMQSDELGNEHIEEVKFGNESDENDKSVNIISRNDVSTHITELMDIQNDGDVRTTLPATIIEITLEPVSKHILTSESPINSEIGSKRLEFDDAKPTVEIQTNPTVKSVPQDKGHVDEKATDHMPVDNKYTVTTASSKLQKGNAVTISIDLFVVINWIVLSYFI